MNGPFGRDPQAHSLLQSSPEVLTSPRGGSPTIMAFALPSTPCGYIPFVEVGVFFKGHTRPAGII
jgi:hypothetical protein